MTNTKSHAESTMIHGIFPPVTTPFENNSVAYTRLTENIRALCRSGIHGIVVLGSNAEAPYLSLTEKLKIIETARQAMPANKPLIAGTGLESIAETIDLTNRAAALGADTALVLTPNFYAPAMSHSALRDYYTAVADASNIPLLIYNVPKYSGLNIGVNTVAALSEHRNIVGLKNSSTDIVHLAEIINAVEGRFSVLAGTGSILYAGLCHGAAGGIVALANIAGAQCVQIYNQFNESRLFEALHLQMQLLPLNRAITATYGIAGLKAAMDMLGLYGGPVRKPLQALDETGTAHIKQIIESAGLG